MVVDFKSLARKEVIRIFLCGDVMIGRGVDQILPDPCPPGLHEDYVFNAKDYVRLAERASGRITAPADLSYVWGAALDMQAHRRPHVRVVNLETSITLAESYETKGINYRVSPKNARCLQRFAVDCCTLANNHVLDWGRTGLTDTLETLRALGVGATGAGRNFEEARRPAVIDLSGGGRVVVLSFALPSSGVPRRWAAGHDVPGVNFLPDLSDASLAAVRAAVESVRRRGDVVILSLHWGPNWGYEICDDQRRFARAAIDSAHASIVHGHSSHHAKGIEVYRDRLILYGCGDFLNDYEGIEGFEHYRGDLSVGYFADVDPRSGDLIALELVPLQIRRLQLAPALPSDVEWLARALDRESSPMGVRVSKRAAGALTASWTRSGEAA